VPVFKGENAMAMTKKEFIGHLAATFAKRTGEVPDKWWNYAEQIYDGSEERDDPDFVFSQKSAEEMARTDMSYWDESCDAAES
jgi:hypothetical protein